MSSPIGSNEIRVAIQLVEARDYDVGPIPAQLFKKTFDGFFTALETTDRELQPKAKSSEFVVSHLALNSCEFGIAEKRRSFGQNTPSAVEFFRRCAEGIYRSDYQTVVRHPRLTRAFVRIVKAARSPFSHPRPIQRHRIADRRLLCPPGGSGRPPERGVPGGQLVLGKRNDVVRRPARSNRLPWRSMDRRFDAALRNNSHRMRVRQVTRGRRIEPVRQ